MEIYQTEEQQVEAIKSFWNENGNSIIAGLVIGFAGFIGFGYYKDNKYQQEVNLSETYQNIAELSGKDDSAYRVEGEKFINENGESSYSALTALSLAKDSASHQDWSQTEKFLKIAVEKSTDSGIKAIATVRLARVQIQLEQYDDAIATVSQPLPESFKSSLEEVKGDAYLKQGKTDLARAAYQLAIDASEENTNQALQMKLDDLAQHIVLTQ